MINHAPSGTYCNECKAEFGNFDTVTQTWTFSDKCVPLASIITISQTIRSKGATRAYCAYHQRKAETWPDGKGGFITWTLAEQMQAALEAEAKVVAHV